MRRLFCVGCQACQAMTKMQSIRTRRQRAVCSLFNQGRRDYTRKGKTISKDYSAAMNQSRCRWCWASFSAGRVEVTWD